MANGQNHIKGLKKVVIKKTKKYTKKVDKTLYTHWQTINAKHKSMQIG